MQHDDEQPHHEPQDADRRNDRDHDETLAERAPDAASPSSPPSPPSPPGTPGLKPLPPSIGRYRILGKLGEGGMGIVYEAEQQNPRRRVALKVVRGGHFVDDSLVKMFQREIDTLARLKHPNIGGIYESGHTEDGQHFFAMELVRGMMLDDYLVTREEITGQEELRFRLALFRQIADAVHYAHQRGVIHRDLKPSNIVVSEPTSPDPDASMSSGSLAGPRLPGIKILDFGLARITEGDMNAATRVTEVGVIKGTLPYMSPEQARGNPAEIDLRSDVYALGVILYEMLAGRRPYDLKDSSLVEAVRVICEQAPTPIRRSSGGAFRIDTDISTIVAKALDKEPDRRYASAAALSEDVGRYLTSQPILARAPSAVYQLRKFAARNKPLVGGLVATLAVLLAGIVVSSILGFREAAQRREAQAARADLETVADFQSRMLERVNVEQMGGRLFEDMRRRLKEALDEEKLPEERRAAALASLDEQLRRVNSTDLALGFLDEGVLARAEEAVAAELSGQPAVSARLNRTLGNTCFELGLYDRAEVLLRKALEGYRGLAPPSASDIASVQRDLAQLLIYKGDLDGAKPEIDAALDAHRAALGDDHAETLKDMSTLALFHREMNDWALAEETYRNVSQRRLRISGKEDELTLSDLDGLAWCLMEQHRYADAEEIQLDVLETARRVLGDESTVTHAVLNNLAVNYVQQGRMDDAEPLYLEELEATRRMLGDEHRETHVSITNLGRLYLRMARFEEAERTLRESVELGRRVLAPGSFGMGISLQGLGESLVGLGRFDEAEAPLLEAWDIMVPLIGEEHPGNIHLAQALSRVYVAKGSRRRAETWARRAGPENPG